MADDMGALGPISYLIVEFPGNKMTGEAFVTLLDLVDLGHSHPRPDVREAGLRWLDASARAPGHRSRRTVRPRCLRRCVVGSPGRERSLRGGVGDRTGVLGGDIDLREPLGDPFHSGVASWRSRAGGRGLHPSGRPHRGARCRRRLIQRRKDQTMPLLRGIARTAAIAGTATAVSNRVSRRQQNRWAKQEDQQYAQQQRTTTTVRAAAAAAAGTGSRPHRATEGSRRAQITGDPHRGRVRGPEGEDPVVLNLLLWAGSGEGPWRRIRRCLQLSALVSDLATFGLCSAGVTIRGGIRGGGRDERMHRCCQSTQEELTAEVGSGQISATCRLSGVPQPDIARSHRLRPSREPPYTHLGDTPRYPGFVTVLASPRRTPGRTPKHKPTNQRAVEQLRLGQHVGRSPFRLRWSDELGGM